MADWLIILMPMTVAVTMEMVLVVVVTVCHKLSLACSFGWLVSLAAHLIVGLKYVYINDVSCFCFL